MREGWRRKGQTVTWMQMLNDVLLHPEHLAEYCHGEDTLADLLQLMTKKVWCRRDVAATPSELWKVQIIVEGGQRNADDFFLEDFPEISFADVRSVLRQFHDQDTTIYVTIE